MQSRAARREKRPPRKHRSAVTRIAVAGFQHETNTFGATRAGFRDFEEADAWPGLLRGAEVVPGTAGINLPMAGFVERAAAAPRVELAPILWCSAEPSAHVTDDAFERVGAMILDGIRDAGAIDGIYLDLHGAMVTESFEDGEGELLDRIRGLVGPALPIAVSLDLHANVTPRMVEHASAITVFRTYPHLDMAETGGRTYAVLERLIGGPPPCKAFRQAPFLVTLPAQYTGGSPCRELYAAVERTGRASGPRAELAMGFPAADIHHAGPSVLTYADTEERAADLADRLLRDVIAAEPSFDCTLLPPEEAVARAMAAETDRPVVIADVQDNPGAGATSDTTGLLRAMVAGGARGAVLALLNDPEAAARAHERGVGASFRSALGGGSDVPGDAPFHGRFRVEALSDGRFPFTGEMYAGGVAELGPTAALRVLDRDSDVRVVVGSRRCQCLDRAIFSHLGIAPHEQRVLAVKSTVHFRADFEPISETILLAEAPGLNPCRLESIPYRRLRNGVRLGAGGRPFAGPIRGGAG